jgi:hypothetical protein
MSMTGKKWAAVGLTVIMAIGLYLRLRYAIRTEHPPLEWDQLEYTKLAIQLLEKGIYAYRDTSPNTLVTPGWPLLLALAYKWFGYNPLEPTLVIIREVLCFIALGSIFFIYELGSRLFNRTTGLLAAAFAAVYPSYVVAASLILTEVPFLTCITAMLYMQVKALQDGRLRDHAIAGLLLGVCVLIRPNVLPLAIVPYLLIWTGEKRVEWRGALLGAGMFALVMMPWWVRNWLTFHEFIFIAKGESGNPFLGGTDPYFRGTIDWSHVNEKEQFAEGVRRIRQGLQENPKLWIGWMTVGKFVVFFKTIWGGGYKFTVPGWYYQLLERMHTYIVYIGWLGALALAPWSRPVRMLLLQLSLFLAVHMAFIPVDRYAYGMLPFLMLITAHVAVSCAVLAWNVCKQATRTVLARR